MTVVLTPGAATLSQLRGIWADQQAVTLHASSHPAIMAANALVEKEALGPKPIYGINTGFGKLANVKIAVEDTGTLQRNLFYRIAVAWANLFVPRPRA